MVMDYTIDSSTIFPIVEEEVSREASQAYSADGVSLYDGIKMISRDEAKKKRMMSEALAAIKIQCNRFLTHGEVTEPDSEPTSIVLTFGVSDRRLKGKEESILTIFRSMAVNFILNKFFASKNQSELAAKYDAMALADVQMLNKLLYEKLPPVYPTKYE